MTQFREVRGRSTAIFTENGKTRVIYHTTPVVAWDEKTVELNTGGYRTVTTKTRMNQAANQFNLGYNVAQKDFGWFVRPYDANGNHVGDWKLT